MNDEKAPDPDVVPLLGLVGPWGIGQFALGQTTRAVLWFAVPSALLFLGALSLPWLGRLLGYGWAFGLGSAGLLVTWAASVVDAHWIPDAKVRRVSPMAVVAYWLIGVAYVLYVRVPMRAQLLESNTIGTDALEPTLVRGDHVLSDKVALRLRAPKRGDFVIFKNPSGPRDFVSRVIAIPGDTLRVKRGHPWLNGWEVPYCVVGAATTSADVSGELDVEFVDGAAYLTFYGDGAGARDDQGPYTVDGHEVWTLGDDRTHLPASNVSLDGEMGLPLFRWETGADGHIDWSRYGTSIADPLLPPTMRPLEAELKKCLAERPPREKTTPPRGPLPGT